MFVWSLLIHLIAASIWVGGHLILVFTILLPALKEGKTAPILEFERKYEKIGMPALLALIATGLFQAYTYQPDITEWLSFSNHINQHIGLKIILLLLTFTLALNVKFNLLKRAVVPLRLLAAHIITVTLISLLFVVTGLSFRFAIF